MTTDAQSVPIVLVSANVPWFRAAEVAVYLGYAQPRVAITKILKGHFTTKFCKISPFLITCVKDDPRARYINIDGLRMLCCKSRKPQSAMLANGLGVNLDDMKTMMQETKTLAVLGEIFKGEVIKLQHVVGPYRVDMFLPVYNVVVECDEHRHRHYTKEHEELRESYITDTLGCKWVRYNPDGKAFSIFQTANMLFRAIKTGLNSKQGL